MMRKLDNEGHNKLPLNRGTQLSQLIGSLSLDPTSPLYFKAKRIVEGMVVIWQRNGGYFKQTDVDAIRGLVLAELSPADFKHIAMLSFANWATPTKLAGPGLPHLNRVNQLIAQQIASLVNTRSTQTHY